MELWTATLRRCHWIGLVIVCAAAAATMMSISVVEAYSISGGASSPTTTATTTTTTITSCSTHGCCRPRRGGLVVVDALVRTSSNKAIRGGVGGRVMTTSLSLATEGSSSSSSSSSLASSSFNDNEPEVPVMVPDENDWDVKYGTNPNWLTGDAIPGKGKLSDMELARQATALGGLEDKWRRERDLLEYEQSIKTGFVPHAELLNGRAAMFFLVTGLLTEYWTGVSIPGQVEEILRIAGVIGFD